MADEGNDQKGVSNVQKNDESAAGEDSEAQVSEQAHYGGILE